MKNILFTLALLISFSSFGQTAEDYFQSGYDKNENGDYYGAISDYTKAIELNPNLGIAYNNRAIAKELSGIDGCADARKAKEFGYNADKLIGMVCN